MFLSHLSLKRISVNDEILFNTSNPTCWIFTLIYHVSHAESIVCLLLSKVANQLGNTLYVCWHRLNLWSAIERKPAQDYSFPAGDNLTITFLDKIYQSLSTEPKSSATQMWLVGLNLPV